MVVAQEARAAAVGAAVLKEGGNAVDAAVATAFALAVTHPIAGNIGGGGFLLWRGEDGRAEVIDFRETAPHGAHPRMFLKDGRYDEDLHHESLRSVGVPGTVAGLHLAWKRHGKLPWKRLLEPAIRLAREGFPVTETLADSFKTFLPQWRNDAAKAQFTRAGEPLRAGEILMQPDLARTLARLAERGPKDFYRGETARLLLKEMNGLITARDLARYRPVVRKPLVGTFHDAEVLCVPPPSGGGVALLAMLNQLEGFDLKRLGADSAETRHLEIEAMRRAFADRARWIGDPAFNPTIPVARLDSKAYAAKLRRSIRPERASTSRADAFAWPVESEETTHLSVADGAGAAVSLTYTLEDNYGAKRVVPGGGFLLNNEMGDFNGEPGRTDATGLIGTKPNLAAPGKRMLSSMCPVIVTRHGKLFMVAGSPGGRTIPNTVLQVLLNVLVFGMEPQPAVDAPRLHHQWLPDQVAMERGAFAPALQDALKAKGHRLVERSRIGVAQLIVVGPEGRLHGAADATRWAESAVATGFVQEAQD